ncbi:MAG: UbiH/UbiF/VisC/COQ6 family ubiquinone biosynthesis hydroxylase [Geminicoccaceae bacterium]|nr:UbiH/UbiF/VisC/COQ6 family ubiquinone biosynthesis hydroxylase [Geminicoccaceae bacterium]
MTGETVRADLAVMGGGLTGMALALAAAAGGAKVAVVEAQPLATMTAAPFDGRVTAVALGSKRLLDAIGAWDGMAAHAQPILDIEVGEADGPARVRYDHRTIGDEPLGWIVENRTIRQALIARAQAHSGIEVLAPARVVGMTLEEAGRRLDLADGRRVLAPLLAVAEGRESRTRADLGIRARRRAYGQTAFVCTLALEHDHGGLAVERFFPDGPFAMLPMTGRRSSIVWALDDRLAGDISGLDDLDFLGEVAERFGDDLGDLALEGPRFAYPLGLVEAERATAPRAALVGDALRGIHPIAGQGWNLALRDVGALAEILADRRRLGLDPGAPEALDRYENWRRFDGFALVAATDGINRLFANDLFPLKLARNFGLGLVERALPVKRRIMRGAMGLAGDLPRLMRGLPL